MRIAPVVAGLILSASATAEPPVPLPDGTYQFQWRDTEFASSPGFPVRVEISGQNIRVVNEGSRVGVPAGEIAHGTLMWHERLSKWILASSPDDATAESVGGCGDNDPYEIDFKSRDIWTCQWGP